MTDVVDVEHVKYQVALMLEQTTDEAKNALEALFKQHPGEVLSALTDGQVDEAAGNDTIEAWVGASDGGLGASGRRPLPNATIPTWSPHHPSKDEDVVVTWEELNPGADLGPYTDLVEVYLKTDGEPELIKEIRIDCEKLAGLSGETATRAITVSAPNDGQMTLKITVNEDGNEDPTATTSQGRKFQTQVSFAVGGADEKPTHGEHLEGVVASAAREAVEQAMYSLVAINSNDEGGQLAAQQFGAGLYQASYISEAFPQAAEDSSTPELDQFFALTHWLYDKGNQLCEAGERPMFDRSGSYQQTKMLAMDLYNLYSSILSEVSVLASTPELALTQIIASLESIKGLVEGCG